MNICLHRPGLVSALGSGAASLAAACTPEIPRLHYEDGLLRGRRIAVGRYRGDWLTPPALSADARSHNNALLWQALAQIDDTIRAAIARYGAARVAVILGTSTSGGDDNRAALQACLDGAPLTATGFSVPRQLMSAPADFTAAAFGTRGICYGISTACTSGARALISAARLLHAGAADAVICGGVDTLSLLTLHGFAALEVLSPGIARPFATARDGINIGEAAAVFVATREALTDDVLCLLGYGASSDAWHMSSPRPDGAGAIAAMQAALARAHVAPEQIGWLNLHGTGTPQNDQMEAQAVAAVLPQTLCSSTKPLTGHTLAAAGALEAALCWLAVSRRDNPDGRLPPMAGTDYDPALAPIRLAGAGARWPEGRRLALSTSFAFGGNNAALIIGEAA
ncbi:MAG: beta-ketoacyl-ACP synthase [Cardiobacterium sp.]